MATPRFPIPQGTLDMLILKILSLEPAHGYGIAQSGVASPGAETLVEGRVAPLRNRARGEVLLVDPRRRAAAGARERDVGSPDHRGAIDLQRGVARCGSS